MIFYLIAGFLGISFLLIPAEAATARVVLYVLCQAVMSGDFYLVDTYTPDMFSTDTRNFAFSLLDAISKVGQKFDFIFINSSWFHILCPN